MMSGLTLVVIAKECIPGRVKTRLTPPLSPQEAARLASASLEDTLHTVAMIPVARRILYIDGAPPRVAETLGFDAVPQSGGDLSERLASLFDGLSSPTLLVGMDTPQLTSRHLGAPLHSWSDDIDAWFGPALDGGFWALGLRHPDGDLVRGVPMSQGDTGAKQLARLHDRGLRVAMLETLRDVDEYADAVEVAALTPDSRFAAAFRAGAPITAGEPG